MPPRHELDSLLKSFGVGPHDRHVYIYSVEQASYLQRRGHGQVGFFETYRRRAVAAPNGLDEHTG